MSSQSTPTKSEEKQKKSARFKLNVQQKNWLVYAHIATAGIWFGTGLCMVIIALHNLKTTNGDELYILNTVMQLLDEVVIIPAATASLITGALLSGLTNWGFVKYYWVITKWIATLSLIIFGTFWLGPWTNAITSISQELRSQALQNPLYMFDDRATIMGGIVQTICLLALIAISVLKPWGRRKSAQS
jgi:hypothetical protein